MSLIVVAAVIVAAAVRKIQLAQQKAGDLWHGTRMKSGGKD